jgi:hypothetical protein
VCRGGLSLPHDNPPRVWPFSQCENGVFDQLQPLVDPQPSQT